MLHILFKRNIPKKVILDLNPTAFEISEEGLDELSIFLPYYKDHPEIRNIVNQRDKFEWAKTYSSLYCYNSLPLKIFYNLIFGKNDTTDESGYVPLELHKQIIPDQPPIFNESTTLDTNLVKCFESIIQTTKEHRSELYVVVSPTYFRLPADLQTIELAEKICAREKIRFLNFSQIPAFLSHGREIFVDLDHINDSSAHIFSSMLSKAIRPNQ